MKKLRLLVTEKCDRACPGCCNKDWDLGSLPVCSDFSRYDVVMLTGGEPMLDPWRLLRIIGEVREQNPDCPIYVYTARTKNPAALEYVLAFADGLCLTLHDQSDYEPWLSFARRISTVRDKSLRLNVFDGVRAPGLDTFRNQWKIKTGMKWIKNCPLPDDEVFMRYCKSAIRELQIRKD